MNTYGAKPLNLLVREITGPDRTAANEAFSIFLSDHNLTREQMVFVKLVVDYVVNNGMLDLKRLQEEPFRSVCSITKFPIDKGRKLVETIKNINLNAGLR
jgi:type I restriction enzyme R subunit